MEREREYGRCAGNKDGRMAGWSGWAGWEALRRAKGKHRGRGAHGVACAGTDELDNEASGKARAKLPRLERVSG